MKPANCPWCGKPMAGGRLDSRHAISWDPDEAPRYDWGKLKTWDGIKELCSELASDLEIQEGSDWMPPYCGIPAYHCPDCQVFLFKGRVK